jgi:ABC-type branched-subunit amino acid transport system substrate-binding protein
LPAFQVHITRVTSKEEAFNKYVMRLYRESAERDRAIFTAFRDDAALCAALEKLGFSESQRERILSVLQRGVTESFTAHLSEDMARLFGWHPHK